VAKSIKPGMRDIDVTALAQHEGQVLGSEQGIFLGASAPVGQRAGFAPRHFQGRTLKAGDHLVLLIEKQRAGGYSPRSPARSCSARRRTSSQMVSRP